MANPIQVHGACLCGRVRFTVGMPPKWVAHCHCSMCRRAHGAGFVTWVGAATEQLALDAGQGVLEDYASSEAAVRSFCGICGASLFFRSSRWPDEVHIARAAIVDDAAAAKHLFAPKAHVFYSDRAPWVDVHDDLPKKGGPTGVELLP